MTDFSTVVLHRTSIFSAIQLILIKAYIYHKLKYVELWDPYNRIAYSFLVFLEREGADDPNKLPNSIYSFLQLNNVITTYV